MTFSTYDRLGWEDNMSCYRLMALACWYGGPVSQDMDLKLRQLFEISQVTHSKKVWPVNFCWESESANLKISYGRWWPNRYSFLVTAPVKKASKKVAKKAAPKKAAPKKVAKKAAPKKAAPKKTKAAKKPWTWLFEPFNIRALYIITFRQLMLCIFNWCF